MSLSVCSPLPDQAGNDDGTYPHTLDSSYGSATINAQPKKIAVTSSIDIAMALGNPTY